MSKLKWAFVLLIALTFTFATAQAQDKPTADAPPKADKATDKADKTEKTEKAEKKESADVKLAAKDYTEMLAKLKQGDTTIDFTKLRLAYTETADYKPYGGSEQRGAMFQAVNDKDYKKALQLSEEMIKTNYVDLVAHLIATKANTELGNTKEAEFHAKVFKGLMSAVTANDGKTAKTAMISIGISEQYFIMSYMGFQRKSKSLLQENGSTFDVHTAENTETKETRQFYFNIDKVFGRF